MKDLFSPIGDKDKGGTGQIGGKGKAKEDDIGMGIAEALGTRI